MESRLSEAKAKPDEKIKKKNQNLIRELTGI
jgi:hypothetical protein